MMLPLRYATVFVLDRRAQRASCAGVWLFNWDRDSDHNVLFRKVAETLELIRERDPRRYARLVRDVPRITLTKSPTPGVFVPKFGGVFLDVLHVINASLHQLSLTVVHEATHARLHRAGIRVDSANRGRIERLCLEQEIRFAVSLGYNADTLGRTDEPYWDEEVRFARRLNELRAVFPEWYVRAYRFFFRP